MTNRKFSDNKLMRLARGGNSVKEMAEELRVGAPAVCKRLKALNISITKDVTLSGFFHSKARRVCTYPCLRE
jgi:hypothetical protein